MHQEKRKSGRRGNSPSPVAAVSSAATKPCKVPTIPFNWFKIAIAGLKQMEVMPARIDRSIWGNKYFRANTKELLCVFRFLGLVERGDEPTQVFGDLVVAFETAAWPIALARTILVAYAPIFESNIARSSPAQLFDVFRRQYRVEGVDVRKSVTFFLQAAKESRVDVGPFLGTAGRRSRPAKSRQHESQILADDLFDRLPAYDPSWSENTKVAWFATYRELIDLAGNIREAAHDARLNKPKRPAAHKQR